jgi:uncharacterized protein YjbI with pentapeptide repeats
LALSTFVLYFCIDISARRLLGAGHRTAAGKREAVANAKQLEVLKQGVQVWNDWRAKNVGVDVDLIRANLREANLREVNFRGVNLRRANLQGANLRGANLISANLSEAFLGGTELSAANLRRADLRGALLSEADLPGADLSRAILSVADLSKANLSRANLNGVNLRGANLHRATLREANLLGADLSGADLIGSNLLKAEVGNTIFGSSDLSEAIGLEDVVHGGPSGISRDVFAHSKGKIPEAFLRGCGLSDWEIELVKLYNPELSNEEINKILYKMYDLRAQQALQISPLFISYSHADRSFVDNLEVYLKRKGIRFWRDVHDAKAGRLEKQIDRAIHQNPTVLLILSSNSIRSDWVEHEVRMARELEKELGRDVLCPVALDDSWKSSPWPKRIMEQVMEYNILDFSSWERDTGFRRMFDKLIDGLELFYKG